MISKARFIKNHWKTNLLTIFFLYWSIYIWHPCQRERKKNQLFINENGGFQIQNNTHCNFVKVKAIVYLLQWFNCFFFSGNIEFLIDISWIELILKREFFNSLLFWYDKSLHIKRFFHCFFCFCNWSQITFSSIPHSGINTIICENLYMRSA